MTPTRIRNLEERPALTGRSPEPVKVECVLTNPLLVEHGGPVLRVLQQRAVKAAFVASPPAKRFVHEPRQKLELYERCVALDFVPPDGWPKLRG